MLYLFWCLLLFLLLTALAAIVLGFKTMSRNFPFKGFACSFVVLVSTLLYYFLGQASDLKFYYSEPARLKRAQQLKLRPMLSELRKQEYKLRYHLDQHPEDIEAHIRLFDVLAILYLEVNEPEKSKILWQEALKLIPNNAEYAANRARIEGLLLQLK